MMYVRRLSFSVVEMEQILCKFDGYVWAAIDPKRKIMAVGDESAETLKYALLGQRCQAADICGVGLDLYSGEIDYTSRINKKLLDKRSTVEVPVEKVEKIETLIRYFFSELPAYRAEKLRPRYAKPAPLTTQ